MVSTLFLELPALIDFPLLLSGSQATDYSLAPEQATIAKLSALKLCSNWEITVLDLVETWTAIPTLSEFAARLSKAFLT